MPFLCLGWKWPWQQFRQCSKSWKSGQWQSTEWQGFRQAELPWVFSRPQY